MIRLDYVDRLRGVAIAAVVLLHCGIYVPNKPAWIAALTGYGMGGVPLFFALSALTLTTISSGRPLDLRSFYLRRFFRIAPMFYLAAAFYLLLNGTSPQYYAPDGIGARHVLMTLAFTHGLAFDTINSVVPGGWSIAAEAMFYLLFPLLLARLTTWQSTAVAAVLSYGLIALNHVVLLGVFGDWEPQYLILAFKSFSFPNNLHTFIVGMLAFHSIRVLENHPAVLESLRRCALPILLLTASVIAACALLFLTSLPITDMVIFLLIMAAFLRDRPALHGHGVLHRLGLVSFSVYLVHFAVLTACSPLVAAMSLPPLVSLSLLYVAVLGASAAIASVCRRYIEQPAIEFGRRFAAAGRPALVSREEEV